MGLRVQVRESARSLLAYPSLIFDRTSQNSTDRDPVAQIACTRFGRWVTLSFLLST